MTASPLSPADTRARVNARLPRRGWRALAMAGLMLLAPVFIVHAQAEAPVKGEIKVTTDGGFVRLVFLFEKEVPASIELTYPIIVVTFKKPVAIAVDRLNASAPDTISAARLDPDGTSIRIALKREVKLNSIPVAERLYVDLLPANWTGIMPGLPREVVTELATRALEAERQLRLQRFQPKEKKPEAIRVKVATQPTLKSIDADVEDDSTSVTFAFNGAPQVRTFREDRSIVVDVEHDGGKPKQAAGEGAKPEQEPKQATAPAIEPPETVPTKDVAAESPPKNEVAEVPAAAPAEAASKADTKPVIAET